MKQKLPIGIKTNPCGFFFMRRDPHTTDEVSEQTTDTPSGSYWRNRTSRWSKTNPAGSALMRRDPHTTDEVSEQTTDTHHPQLGGANN
jgi:hypothetical protein